MTEARASRILAPWIALAGLFSCVILVAAPAPDGLPESGKRVLAVAILAIALWCTEAVPAAVTGLILIVGLVVSGGVPGFREALSGFSDPVVYFLIGVLTIGLAVAQSGLAERVARFFLRRSRGSSGSLYRQLLLAFPLLTVILPSATTRTAILVHVYEQALEMSRVPKRDPLSSAIMMALNSINRLASTIFLTGGVTPMVAAALIASVNWNQWLLLMSVPFLALLTIGALLIYFIYRDGFQRRLPELPPSQPQAMTGKEIRTIVITGFASALWLTDSIHHFHPALPAILAWILLLMPGIGVLTWREFERDIGWTNLFVIAPSLSLAKALIDSGASAWIAQWIVHGMPQLREHPTLVILVLMLASVPVRLLIPNITGFLATTIPIAMAIGTTVSVNPLVCALAVTVAGDAVLYYPAQSTSSLAVVQRGFLSAPEIFRFGVWMTVVAVMVVLFVALPYWALVGEPLRAP